MYLIDGAELRRWRGEFSASTRTVRSVRCMLSRRSFCSHEDDNFDFSGLIFYTIVNLSWCYFNKFSNVCFSNVCTFDCVQILDTDLLQTFCKIIVNHVDSQLLQTVKITNNIVTFYFLYFSLWFLSHLDIQDEKPKYKIGFLSHRDNFILCTNV